MKSSTPQDMPITNRVRRDIILSKLIEVSEGTRTHKAEVMVDGKREVVESTVTTPAAPKWPLAANVQARNVDRLARRWA